MDTAEIVRRAEDLVSALEGGVVPLDLLVAKALGLARAVADQEAIEWLSHEAVGYDNNLSTPVQKKYAIITARWDGSSDTFYDKPAAHIAHTVDSMSQSLEAHKQFQPSGDYAFMHLNEKVKNITNWSNAITPLQNVLSGVRTQLHLFAVRVLTEAQFSDTSRSIFQRFQSAIDTKLSVQAGKAFEKLPHVFERLRAGDPEAVSHALTSCRRIIDAFADAMFPPVSSPVLVDGTELDCGPDKTKNRIRALVAQTVPSRNRRERMNKNLGALYDRLSAGVHADVDPDEAQALVLNTYLLLGEIISLPRGPRRKSERQLAS